MKLICPKNGEHKLFLRESYNHRGAVVNIEPVDEYGRFLGDQLDLYTGNVSYKYVCSDCGEIALEMN